MKAYVIDLPNSEPVYALWSLEKLGELWNKIMSKVSEFYMKYSSVTWSIFQN